MLVSLETYCVAQPKLQIISTATATALSLFMFSLRRALKADRRPREPENHDALQSATDTTTYSHAIMIIFNNHNQRATDRLTSTQDEVLPKLYGATSSSPTTSVRTVRPLRRRASTARSRSRARSLPAARRFL